MRRIEETTAFRRDLRRVKANPVHRSIGSLLAEVIGLLRSDLALPERCRDHRLSGPWADHRDCHVKPDLVLIYRKVDDALQLVRLGSHSELFGR